MIKILYIFFKKADTVFDWISKICAVISGSIIVGMALMITAGVINRSFIGFIWLFVEEWGSLALVPLSYLAFGYTMRQGRHLKMDLVFNKLPPKGQTILCIFCAVFSIVCLTYMVGFALARIDYIVVRGVLSSGPMQTPLLPFAAAMLVGICLFLVDVCFYLIHKVIELRVGPGGDVNAT